MGAGPAILQFAPLSQGISHISRTLSYENCRIAGPAPVGSILFAVPFLLKRTMLP